MIWILLSAGSSCWEMEVQKESGEVAALSTKQGMRLKVAIVNGRPRADDP
jgi:hypothetical protein